MKFMTILYGTLDQTRTMFTAYDEVNRRVLIKKELLPSFIYDDGEEAIHFPFYCQAKFTLNYLERGDDDWVAIKCFGNTPEMIEDVNMEIDALEHEIHELIEQCSSNQTLK